MRVLFIHPGPEFSVQDVHAGWVEALRTLGCEVAEYNSHDRMSFYGRALLPETDALGRQVNDEFGLPLVKRAMSDDDAMLCTMQGISHAMLTFWPDVIVLVSAFFTTAGQLQLMRLRNMKVVLIHTESPYQDDAQLRRAPHADLNCINDPTNIAQFEELGVPVLYMPHAYRPSLHFPRRGPVDPSKASDFCFIGTAFRSRIDLFERMNFGDADVLLGGSCWYDLDPDSRLRKYVGHELDVCVDNKDAAEHYRHAKMSLNLYRREGEDAHLGEGWSMGPREVELAACGLPFLRDPRPEGDKLLSMLPTFATPEDASEQLQWWLKHDTERDEAARLARAAVADRTFLNNAKRMLRALDEL